MEAFRQRLPLQKRQLVLLIFDFFFLNLALYLAFWLRFEGYVPIPYYDTYLNTYLIITLVQLVVFIAVGLYNNLWSYASVEDLVRVVLAVSFAMLAAAAANYLLGFTYPRSIYPIAWLLNNFFIGGMRFGFRIWRHYYYLRFEEDYKKILIYGAGDAGVMVLNELQKHRDLLKQYPIGFIDDDEQKWNMTIQGLKVFGGRQKMPELIRTHKVDEVLIAMPSAPNKVIRELVELCHQCQVKVKTLPGVYELLNGVASIQHIRDVQIEDLLGREPVKIDLEQVSGYLSGAVVLVTGAGGSIGSELCRQIARLHPRQLLLFGHGENSIYEIHRELVQKHRELAIEPLIGDIKDKSRLEEVFDQSRPQVVFHAAAHKHVPLMQTNPGEAVKNNILGTMNVAETAHRFGAARFVLISTDKAVNPTSVMGASKRVAEIIIQCLNQVSDTKFCAVRFGNVLGSRGSVVPLFKEQIARGGPVTVTHPDMVRYFMTITEAAQLVIQAGAMVQNGEIFVLDMGEPVRILNLARDMIRLSGFEPGRDIEIKFTGIRPGEKLREELLTEEEGITATKHKRIFIAPASSLSHTQVAEELHDLEKLLQTKLDFVEKKTGALHLRVVEHG
jgi:FlaA1/EpsC-like NDP-sugar epimerase